MSRSRQTRRFQCRTYRLFRDPAIAQPAGEPLWSRRRRKRRKSRRAQPFGVHPRPHLGRTHQLGPEKLKEPLYALVRPRPRRVVLFASLACSSSTPNPNDPSAQNQYNQYPAGAPGQYNAGQPGQFQPGAPRSRECRLPPADPRGDAHRSAARGTARRWAVKPRRSPRHGRRGDPAPHGAGGHRGAGHAG